MWMILTNVPESVKPEQYSADKPLGLVSSFNLDVCLTSNGSLNYCSLDKYCWRPIKQSFTLSSSLTDIFGSHILSALYTRRLAAMLSFSAMSEAL